ncbi:MAG TPA: ornithine cyclodeaminase family protein [Candidatus Acidoferrales bacterium]|nr:ornithine cyclodeaminase family protein [Candidatus Acidoferrales bacterium]
MRILELPEIRRALAVWRPNKAYAGAILRMREALIAYSRGECDTPMPMHLEIAPQNAEVHMKSSYRRGGRYFAVKMASTFPGNARRGLATGNGMMMLSSAETGEPEVFLADAGHLTDFRTAAVAAMAARELGRADASIGILGTGIQARLQAQLHAEVLDLKHVWIWGRNPARVEECRRDLAVLLPRATIGVADSPRSLAQETNLIVTATASRQPLLAARDLRPGTHVSAVGSDAPGKQELDPQILRNAALLLVDSRRQCEKLGELQHAPDQWQRAVELGAFCESGPEQHEPQQREPQQHEPKPHDNDAAPSGWDRAGVTVCDFTGLGVEDLYIAEYCYQRAN